MFCYVYILTNKQDRIYIGCTENLKDRLEKHNNGYVQATKFYKPWRIKTYFAFEDKYIAFNFEKYLKTGSGRAFLTKHGIR